MSERLPYQQEPDPLHQLPLPDENGAWAQMERLLDEEEDDRVVVPPPVLRGCAGWMLLLLLAVLGGFWLIWDHQKEEERSATKDFKDSVILQNRVPASQKTSITLSHPTLPSSKEKNTTTDSKKENKGFQNIEVYRSEVKTKAAAAMRKTVVVNRKLKNKIAATKENKGFEKDESAVPHERELKQNGGSQNDWVNRPNAKEPATNTSVDSMAITSNKRLGENETDSVQEVEKNITIKENERVDRRYALAFGMALQQQVPLKGQQAVPYDYLGRRSTIADYVPSLYLRLYKQKRWFLQSEFKYGAPQYTKEFVYKQSFTVDTFSATTTTTAYRLKKTFYHQLPLSFHWYLLPNWSVGTGVVYNRFYSAVSDKEVSKRSGASAVDTVISKVPVLDKNDTLFRQSNLQLLLESQYRWKRFSLGARYMQGLQPYIQYKDAAGQSQQKKNNALQLFLRFELWRSKTE